MKKIICVIIAVVIAITATAVAIVAVHKNHQLKDKSLDPVYQGNANRGGGVNEEDLEKISIANKCVYIFDGYEHILMFDEENPNAIKCELVSLKSGDIRIFTNIKDLNGDEAIKRLQSQVIMYYTGSIADWNDSYLCGKDSSSDDPARTHGVWRWGKISSYYGTFIANIIRDSADMPDSSTPTAAKEGRIAESKEQASAKMAEAN